jgi:hypothetical protein
LNILELSGITKRHKKEVRRTLENYSKYILFVVDKEKSPVFIKAVLGISAHMFASLP